MHDEIRALKPSCKAYRCTCKESINPGCGWAGKNILCENTFTSVVGGGDAGRGDVTHLPMSDFLAYVTILMVLIADVSLCFGGNIAPSVHVRRFESCGLGSPRRRAAEKKKQKVFPELY